MGEAPRQWDGKAWQQYVNDLLTTHYSFLQICFQRIPDNVGGDHGLEGISDTGDAYQSYADEGTATNEVRTKKQKKKIGEDLKKLETYATWWQDFLGTRQIRSWTLMVPDFRDKEVAMFARKRARELVTKALPFIAENFAGCVKTQEDYAVARSLIRDPRLPGGSSPEVTSGEIEDFKTTQPKFVANIDAKLKKAMSGFSDEDRTGHLDKLLKWHLHTSNLLEILHRSFPSHWEDLDALIRTTGTSIETEGAFDSRPANQRLTATRREFKEKLKADMPYFQDRDSETLSWGTVAAWLGECPLNFPGT
jgi:hypothetical protein